MKIVLYKTADENIRVTKSLTDSMELIGFLRGECSILNPTIEIESDMNISNYNYARIEDFNRYYFITDIVSVNNKFWKVSMRCDVLMSYANSIKKLEANVLRNKSQYNLMLEDNNLTTYSDDRTQCFNFPNTITAGGTNQFKYYLTLIGGGGN